MWPWADISLWAALDLVKQYGILKARKLRHYLTGNAQVSDDNCNNYQSEDLVDVNTNCDSFSLRFDSQATKHQTILPIVIH